jgi:NAD(P)H-hydrate epimerase
LRPLLAPRRRCAHKGDFGHLLVIGGNRGMAGAATLAAEAAARCGAGLVSVAVHPGSEAAILARRPELMVHAVEHGHELEALLARATALVIGPGLGSGAWAQRLLQRALQARLPCVLDADALNLLAAGEVQPGVARAAWVLTPHPGEAGRLLGCTAAEVNRDRFAALAQLVRRFDAAVILKGAGSLVSAPAAPRSGVCPYGNPGMASGGMGDVLSGIAGALLAQRLDTWAAARLAVCLHARAADLAAAADGESGLLATDLLAWLRRLLNGWQDA